VPLTTIVKKDIPSPNVGTFHVEDQHKHNLVVTIDVEVSSPCGKNKDHLVVKAHVDPTTMVCQHNFIKKDVRKELKLVDNSNEEEEDKAIDFNETVQDGLLLPSTHKDEPKRKVRVMKQLILQETNHWNI
jgi:hypothetical protein